MSTIAFGTSLGLMGRDRVRADIRKADTTFLDEDGFHDLFQRVRHASSKEF